MLPADWSYVSQLFVLYLTLPIGNGLCVPADQLMKLPSHGRREYTITLDRWIGFVRKMDSLLECSGPSSQNYLLSCIRREYCIGKARNRSGHHLSKVQKYFPISKVKRCLGWLVPGWVTITCEVVFPARPRLGEVNVGNWLKALRIKGDTPVVIETRRYMEVTYNPIFLKKISSVFKKQANNFNVKMVCSKIIE